MNKDTRRIVLYGLFGLFFVLGATAVFYAQGYRFDPGTFKIQKIGAVYVRTYPKAATVRIDGKSVDRGAMLLNSGTLIQDLFPKTHELVAEAPGFVRWVRNISVKPALVTEVQAILLPEKPELVRKTIPLGFWALPDMPLIETSSGLSYSGYKIPGSFSSFNYDENQVLTRDASKNYYATNLNPVAALKPQKLSNIAGGKVFFDKTSGQFVSWNGTAVALLSPGSVPSTIFTAPKGQTIIGSDVSKNFLAFATLDYQNKSWLWLYEKLSGNTKQIDSVPGRTTDLGLSENGEVALLEDSGDLYLYDPSSGNISKSSSGVKSFSFSKDGTALAILSEKTLEVYGADGYSRLNLAFLTGTERMFWYADNDHLFLQFPDHLGLLDLMDFQPENVQFINNSTQNSYDPISNILYFEKDGGLYRLSFPS